MFVALRPGSAVLRRQARMATSPRAAPAGRMYVSDKVSPATGRAAASTAERGDETSDSGAGASSKESRPAERPGDSPAGGTSLAAVLETLRDDASAHDD